MIKQIFQWNRRAEGYRIVKNALVPVPLKKGIPPLFIRFRPLQNHGLFLQFAELSSAIRLNPFKYWKEKERLAIVNFANRYGMLTISTAILESQFTESLQLWEREIIAMNKAVQLWQKGGSASQRQKLVNDHLRNSVSPALFHNADGNEVLFYAPNNLLGAMWLQLATAIESKKQYQQCPECGKLIEIAGSGLLPGSRSHRKYCSDACKQKAYRARSEKLKPYRPKRGNKQR